MERPILVEPNRRYFDSYLRALHEFKEVSSCPKHFQNEIENFPDNVLINLKREKMALNSQRTYWLVEGYEFIGTVQLRLIPSARFPNIKSNIYYDVRPSKRRLGYGTRALSLVLNKARQLGLRSVILSCDRTNLPSKRIIEAAGGELVRTERVPDRVAPVLMFRLSTAKTQVRP